MQADNSCIVLASNGIAAYDHYGKMIYGDPDAGSLYHCWFSGTQLVACGFDNKGALGAPHCNVSVAADCLVYVYVCLSACVVSVYDFSSKVTEAPGKEVYQPAAGPVEFKPPAPPSSSSSSYSY